MTACAPHSLHFLPGIIPGVVVSTVGSDTEAGTTADTTPARCAISVCTP